MREIKFRAWDKRYQKMHPRLVHITMDGSAFSHDHRTPDNIRDGAYGIPARDCVLMQYTGLKGKNGKEIYEGDVLYLELDDVNGRVLFVGGGFWVKWPRFKEYTFTTALWELHSSNKVIGNIYENPELLK